MMSRFAMSRTWKTAPFGVVERHVPPWRMSGIPLQLWGVRRRYSNRLYHRADRTAERNALAHLEEPPPKTPRTVDWDLF